jgi:hypothetical protein
MTITATRPGPNGRARPSLGDQLDRLDGILNGLSDALNESVTATVSAAVGQAVREAVTSATLEFAARPAARVEGVAEPELMHGYRSRGLTARVRAMARCAFALAGGTRGWVLRRLGAPLVALVRRTMRAPARFAALGLVGLVAGAAAGFCGPLVGAALGGLAGFLTAVATTPHG